MTRLPRRFVYALLSAVLVGSFAHDAAALSVKAPAVSARRGQRVVIPIEIGDTDGSSLVSCEMTIAYDAALVTATGVVASDTLSAGWATETNNLPGEMKIAIASADPASSAGTLFAIEFSVGGALGVTGIDLRNVLLNEGRIAPTVIFGSITVANGIPAADPASVTAIEGSPTTVTVAASDVDDDPLTYRLASNPKFGVLTGSLPTMTYTPNRQPTVGFETADSFSFIANDGNDDSEAAVVSISITPVNDPPVARIASSTTDEDTPVAITVEAEDADGDAVSFTVSELPTFGALELAATSVTYTPSANANGVDRFALTATDGVSTSEPIAVEVTVNSVDDAPTFDLPTVAAFVNDGSEHRIPISGIATGGSDEASQTISFAATSDNRALVSDARVDGTGSTRVLVVDLSPGAFGTAAITVVGTESGPGSTGKQATKTLSLTVTVPPPVLGSAVVTPTTPRNPGTIVHVTAEAREATSVRFSISGVPAAANVVMEPEGRAEPHGFGRFRGTYRVSEDDPVVTDSIVTVSAANSEGTETSVIADGTVTIRLPSRAWSGRVEPATARPGDSLSLVFEGEAGLSVTADVTAVEPTAAALTLSALRGSRGVYVGRYVVPTRLTTDDGVKDIVFSVVLPDASVETVAASVNLETGKRPYRDRIAAVEAALAALESEASGLALVTVPLCRAALASAKSALDAGELRTAGASVAEAERLLRTARLELEARFRVAALNAELATALARAEAGGIVPPATALAAVNAAMALVTNALERGDYELVSALADDALRALNELRALLGAPKSRDELVTDSRSDLIRAKAAAENALASVTTILGSLDSDALESALDEVRRASSRTASDASRAASLAEVAAETRDAFASAFALATLVSNASNRLSDESNRAANSVRFVFESTDINARRDTAPTFEKRAEDARLSSEAAKWAADNARRLAEAAERSGDPEAATWRAVALEAERTAARAAIGTVVLIAENTALFVETDSMECQQLANVAATQAAKEAQSTARDATRTTDTARDRLRDAERELAEAESAAGGSDDPEARARRDEAARQLAIARGLVNEAVASAKQAGKSATDLDDDGKNDLSDLARVADIFGDANERAAGDVNGDGVVDIRDLVYAALGTSAEGVLIRGSSPAAPGALFESLFARVEWLSSSEAIIVLSARDVRALLALKFVAPTDAFSARLLSVEAGSLWQSLPYIAVGDAVVGLGQEVSGSGELLRLRVRCDTPSDLDAYLSSARLEVCDSRLSMTAMAVAVTDSQETTQRDGHRFAAFANYPNPFNPETWIPFELSESAEVVVDVFDERGNLIRRIRLGAREPGLYASRDRAAYWDGTNNAGEPAASGVYRAVVRAGAFSASRKIVLLK